MDKMILSCLAEVHRGDLSCDESGNWHSRRLRQPAPSTGYLRISLGVLLVLIGTKLLLKAVLVEGPTTVFFTLGAVVLILAGGRVASLLFGKRAPNSS